MIIAYLRVDRLLIYIFVEFMERVFLFASLSVAIQYNLDLQFDDIYFSVRIAQSETDQFRTFYQLQ